MRILFVTSNRIGDAVLSTGLLDHLLRTHPAARFTVACGPAAVGVFARMPRLERVIAMEKRPRAGHWLRLWTETVGQWWALVVDVRASLISFLIPAGRRAVMRKRPGWFTTPKVDQLGAILGLHPAPMPVVWTAAEDAAHAAMLVPGEAPLVLLAPTANWDGKLWPPERFAALFAGMAGALPGARAAVLGGNGPAERAMAAPLLAALPGAIDLVGALSLPQVAAVMQRARLFIGNDSGLMHLAAASGTPTLGLYGPTKANIPQFAPAGRRTAMAVSPTLDMADLTIADVLAAAGPLLTKPPHAA